MGKLRGNPTPALDTMAQNGMKFRQGYAEPSCTPSRIAMMTGRHPVRTGVNVDGHGRRIYNTLITLLNCNMHSTIKPHKTSNNVTQS